MLSVSVKKQVICDSPAKAFLLNIKGHNSHVGCNTCTEEGEYKEKRIAFLGINALLNTPIIILKIKLMMTPIKYNASSMELEGLNYGLYKVKKTANSLSLVIFE